MFETALRSGPKTPEYEALRRAVFTVATNALRAGFAPLEPGVKHPLTLTLYTPTEVYADPSNCGKGELDGLQDAGLIANDKFFSPVTYGQALAPATPARVVVIIERRFPAADRKKKAANVRPALTAGQEALAQVLPGYRRRTRLG